MYFNYKYLVSGLAVVSLNMTGEMVGWLVGACTLQSVRKTCK